MKTRCPACQTVFLVAPEQLKVRAGKVRCGECQEVFNALDHLLDETIPWNLPPAPEKTQARSSEQNSKPPHDAPCDSEKTAEIDENLIIPDVNADIEQESESASESLLAEETPGIATLDAVGLAQASHATELILPRDTTQIPGYSKWSEGVMSQPLSPVGGKTLRWPFIFAAILLILTFTGQIAFHFRSEISTTSPSLRPALEALAQMFDADIPLPRHVELISIEASDLQSDPAHGNLLVLNATLRNRANYTQEFPALELSLTDTQDSAIARRVILSDEYLSRKATTQTFAANSDVAVRLWIEAKEVSAAGYRLYVFYP